MTERPAWNIYNIDPWLLRLQLISGASLSAKIYMDVVIDTFEAFGGDAAEDSKKKKAFE